MISLYYHMCKLFFCRQNSRIAGIAGSTCTCKLIEVAAVDAVHLTWTLFACQFIIRSQISNKCGWSQHDESFMCVWLAQHFQKCNRCIVIVGKPSILSYSESCRAWARSQQVWGWVITSIMAMYLLASPCLLVHNAVCDTPCTVVGGAQIRMV